MIRKGIRPGFRFGFNREADGELWRREYRFRRSWVAIAVLLVMDAIFLVPAITTFRQISGWGDINSLFDLVGVLFMSAWLLGWSMAPLAMTAILLMLLFGREVVKVRPGTVELFLGLPFAGVSMNYEVARMRNLRIEKPVAKSGKAWRGAHFEFDYGANSVAFGSDVGPIELGEVESGIRMASGKSIRRGDATDEELAPKWEPAPEETPAAPVVEATVAESPGGRLTPSVLMLILANLVPVGGAAFLGWALSDVMVIYWAESAVIGLFNLLKIVRIGGWPGLFAGLFFLGHFGGFMAVHFLFIYTIFVEGFGGSGPSGNLSEVFAIFARLWPALLALAVSHGFSYFTNFVGKQEFRGKTIKTQMSEPYSRIVFMHLVLIFGGGLVMALGEPTMVLLIVIVLKIIFDVRAHAKQRLHGRQAGNSG